MKKSLLVATVFLCAIVIAVQAQTNALRVNPNGNVAIGQDTADEKLVVNGNIKAVGNLIANGMVSAAGLAVTGNITAVGSVTAGSIVSTSAISATGPLSTQARVTDKSGFVMPVGSVLAYAGATPPQGWLLCDGRALNRTDPQYTDLFAAIGTAWGAPDTASFNLPDLRGMFLRGVSGDATTDPDKADRVAAKAGGNTGNAVGSTQTDTLKNHLHPVTDPGHSHYLPASDNGGWNYGNVLATDRAESGMNTTSSVTHISIPNSGGGNETRPANAYVTYIIKY